MADGVIVGVVMVFPQVETDNFSPTLHKNRRQSLSGPAKHTVRLVLEHDETGETVKEPKRKEDQGRLPHRVVRETELGEFLLTGGDGADLVGGDADKLIRCAVKLKAGVLVAQQDFVAPLEDGDELDPRYFILFFVL